MVHALAEVAPTLDLKGNAKPLEKTVPLRAVQFDRIACPPRGAHRVQGQALVQARGTPGAEARDQAGLRPAEYRRSREHDDQR